MELIQTDFLAKIEASISYDEYKKLIESLLAINQTTGSNHSADYLHYTRLNLQRQNRLEKTIRLSEELRSAVQKVKRNYVWLVLVEAWCGDVAQNLPILHKLEKESDHIQLRIILRDAHPELMDKFRTEGGRSIPKLICLEAQSLEVCGSWGPRPEAAQEIIRAFKRAPEGKSYMDVIHELQAWYAKDKTVSLQAEMTEFISRLS
jgi:hypothetical protein